MPIKARGGDQRVGNGGGSGSSRASVLIFVVFLSQKSLSCLIVVGVWYV